MGAIGEILGKGIVTIVLGIFIIAVIIFDFIWIIQIAKDKIKLIDKLDAEKNSIDTLFKELVDKQNYCKENMSQLLIKRCILYPDKVKELYDNIKKSNAKNLYENSEKFYNFRVNHYNDEIEKLFKKLDINLKRIKENEIKNIGTIKDYDKFIRDNIDEHLDNENYDKTFSIIQTKIHKFSKKAYFFEGLMQNKNEDILFVKLKQESDEIDKEIIEKINNDIPIKTSE